MQGLLRANVKQLLGSGHPALDTIAKYYFQAEGKHIRPLIVLLMSQATNGMAPGYASLLREAEEREGQAEAATDGIDEPLTSPTILNDQNPDILSSAKSFLSNPLSGFTPRPTPSSHPPPSVSHLLPTQRRLAEITEMIHVASLLHDDVIDLAETRRSNPSAPSLFGNKLTVLAGDFLLARASLALSRLGSNEVVELVASVLANLVEGEVMQMKGNTPDGGKLAGKLTPEIFEHYMKKTYLKTASLIAKSTRATTILGGCGTRQGWEAGEPVKDLAYTYGRNIGIAFQVRLVRARSEGGRADALLVRLQLVDDMLDFTATAAELGKPGQGADLKLGLATAPALYAWEEFPELGAMIERKFSGPDDVEQVRRALSFLLRTPSLTHSVQARYLISKSSGAERTASLAAEHSKTARAALEGLPDSEARTALDELARDTLSRTK